jgi:hypothetical protein
VLLALIAVFLGFGSLKYIAAWQMLAGLTILGNLLYLVIQGIPGRFGILSLVTTLGVGAFAVGAGLLLWQGSPLGVRLSLVAQAFQTAWVSLPFLQIGSTLGPLAGVRLTSSTLTFTMGFYGRGGLSFGGVYPLDVTINVLGVFAFLALWKRRQSTAPLAAV